MPSEQTPREHLYSRRPRTPGGNLAIEALQELSWSAQGAQERALTSLEMGPLDARALLYLVQEVRHESVVRPKDLSTVLGVSSAAITKLVDRLVQAGHVERQPNPKDRRGIVLIPSPATAERLAEVYGHIHTPLVAVIEGLSDDELEVIARFSTRLADALDAERRH